ncbi:unnamed protein product [marine sediment metagenome]|uniref:Uncharacterized protein n=1 Tax=marine sediment metagenome TaxID=412755 RepID=X0TJ71_9ZZZZ
MSTSANIRFEDWEAEQMKDPELRAALEELEPAYRLDRLRIMRGMADWWVTCDQCDSRYPLSPYGVPASEGIPLHRNRDRTYMCRRCGSSIKLANIWQPPKISFGDRCRGLASRIFARLSK